LVALEIFRREKKRERERERERELWSVGDWIEKVLDSVCSLRLGVN